MTNIDTEGYRSVHYDLLLTDASKFKLYLSVKDLKSGVLDDMCKTFQQNIERVAILAAITQLTVRAATQNTLMLCQATFEVLGKAVMDDAEARKHRQEIGEAYERIASTHYRDDGFFAGKQWMLFKFQCDALQFHKDETVNSPLARPGYHALLASQVIGAWTALETLIEDVWVAAVNAHPILAIGFCKDRNFTIDELDKHDFNWSGRVGNLLKDRMEFGHLEKERSAYVKTFPKLKKLNAALASGKLEAAHCVRNSLVHDAGVANEGYEKNRQKFHRPWSEIPEGNRLPLDGRNVAMLTSIIVLTGNRLLREVDCWLLRLAWPKSKSRPPAL